VADNHNYTETADRSGRKWSYREGHIKWIVYSWLCSDARFWEIWAVDCDFRYFDELYAE